MDPLSHQPQAPRSALAEAHRERRPHPVPLELWLYVVFSVLVVVADFSLLLLGPNRLRWAVVPFVGWTACAPYLVGLPCAWLLIHKRDLRGRTGIKWILLIYIAYGVGKWLVFGPRASTNPFLAVHAYSLLWTVALPALWLLVMRSPRIRDYCQAPPAEGAQPVGAGTL